MLRSPDSIPVGDIIIEDVTLEPFFISKSTSGGYTVYKRVEKGDSNKKYIETICYPATFNYALKRVATEKLNEGEQKVYSLQEYVGKFESIQKAITEATLIG